MDVRKTDLDNSLAAGLDLNLHVVSGTHFFSISIDHSTHLELAIFLPLSPIETLWKEHASV